MSIVYFDAPVKGREFAIEATFLTEPEFYSVYGQDLGPILPAKPKTYVRTDSYRFDRDHTEAFRGLLLQFLTATTLRDRSVLTAPLESKGTPDQPVRYLRPLFGAQANSVQGAADLGGLYKKMPNPIPLDMIIFLPPDTESRDKIADRLIPFRDVYRDVLGTDATTVAVRMSYNIPVPRLVAI